MLLLLNTKNIHIAIHMFALIEYIQLNHRNVIHGMKYNMAFLQCGLT